jgi:hypothetical protein
MSSALSAITVMALIVSVVETVIGPAYKSDLVVGDEPSVV